MLYPLSHCWLACLYAPASILCVWFTRPLYLLSQSLCMWPPKMLFGVWHTVPSTSCSAVCTCQYTGIIIQALWCPALKVCSNMCCSLRITYIMLTTHRDWTNYVAGYFFLGWWGFLLSSLCVVQLFCTLWLPHLLCARYLAAELWLAGWASPLLL